MQNKKSSKPYGFKDFSWSEWRDSNSRPHGPEPSRDVPQQRHKGNLKLSSKYAESLDNSCNAFAAATALSLAANAVGTIANSITTVKIKLINLFFMVITIFHKCFFRFQMRPL